MTHILKALKAELMVLKLLPFIEMGWNMARSGGSGGTKVQFVAVPTEDFFSSLFPI